MKGEHEEIAEAIRIEVDESNDDLLIVFRVTNVKYKHLIKQNWTKDILFRMVDDKLISHEE